MAGRVSGEMMDGMVVRSAVNCVSGVSVVWGWWVEELHEYLVGEGFQLCEGCFVLLFGPLVFHIVSGRRFAQAIPGYCDGGVLDGGMEIPKDWPKDEPVVQALLSHVKRSLTGQARSWRTSRQKVQSRRSYHDIALRRCSSSWQYDLGQA